MSQTVYTALFSNRNKKQEKHPDYVMKWSKEEGTSKVEIPEAGSYELAVWIKKDKNGNDYLSVGITHVEPKPQSEPSENQTTDGDDIPF